MDSNQDRHARRTREKKYPRSRSEEGQVEEKFEALEENIDIIDQNIDLLLEVLEKVRSNQNNSKLMSRAKVGN